MAVVINVGVFTLQPNCHELRFPKDVDTVDHEILYKKIVCYGARGHMCGPTRKPDLSRSDGNEDRGLHIQ